MGERQPTIEQNSRFTTRTQQSQDVEFVATLRFFISPSGDVKISSPETGTTSTNGVEGSVNLLDSSKTTATDVTDNKPIETREPIILDLESSKTTTTNPTSNSSNGAEKNSSNGADKISSNGADKISSNGADKNSSNGADKNSSNGADKHSSNGANKHSSNGADKNSSNGADKNSSTSETVQQDMKTATTPLATAPYTASDSSSQVTTTTTPTQKEDKLKEKGDVSKNTHSECSITQFIPDPCRAIDDLQKSIRNFWADYFGPKPCPPCPHQNSLPQNSPPQNSLPQNGLPQNTSRLADTTTPKSEIGADFEATKVNKGESEIMQNEQKYDV